MATEDVNEALAAAEVPIESTTEKQPHKLERKWCFWFDNQSKPKQGAAWGASLRKASTFDTVEDFWGLHETIFIPSKLTPNADIHLFKAGVEPKWEDPECAHGGKWTFVVTNNRKQALDKAWLETLMALIGEQFDEADEICGVVASVRLKQDKLSLWTRTKSNEAVLVRLRIMFSSSCLFFFFFSFSCFLVVCDEMPKYYSLASFVERVDCFLQ
ncbi:eukaryotic translation initiation factor isoform X1 [Brassica rapa]|uniref:eukaryotic translation initiation factor isoform X1 n=1 Tax=Brassica campestris TaxID=3711 RepID=UPI00142DBDD8|nr:eukaryotic translation initiation factor isoform X1 [Brassica rapa]